MECNCQMLYGKAKDAHLEFVRNFFEWYGRNPGGLI